MLKILTFLMIVFGVYYFRRLLNRASDEETLARSQTSPIPETMVSCAYCSLLVPESESLRLGKFHFCSTEHRALGPKDAQES